MSSMQSSGNVPTQSLIDGFRALKDAGRSGDLTVRAGKREGRVLFTRGDVAYAEVADAGWPLARTLIRQRLLTSGQLAALAGPEGSPDGLELAGALLQNDLLSREELESRLAHQIHDAVFQLLLGNSAQHEFHPAAATTEAAGAEEAAAGAPGSAVTTSTPGLRPLGTELVIGEGLRRVVAWGDMMERLGSLEKVPHLLPWRTGGSVSISASDWRILAHVDGRRDVLTIAEEAAAGRFETVSALDGAVRAGLVAVKDPALELLGQTLAICVRGPIDIYNGTLLAALADSEVTHHVRLERIDEEEVEVRIAAGVRKQGAAGSCLIYSADSRVPREVVMRLAMETSGFLVLVNINSTDAVLASRPDIALMDAIADRPYLVATYASLADERIEEAEVRQLLNLPGRVPVVNSGLRDPGKTAEAMDALVALIP